MGDLTRYKQRCERIDGKSNGNEMRRRLPDVHSDSVPSTAVAAPSIQPPVVNAVSSSPSLQTIGIVSTGLILLGFVASRIIKRIRDKSAINSEKDQVVTSNTDSFSESVEDGNEAEELV